MNVNSETENHPRKPKIFNNPERFIEGWYWVIPSENLQVGEVKPVKILGRNLVIYRGQDKRAVIFDAYCPHMGAHLCEGTVEGNELRCVFHHWKFDAEGICVDIPYLDQPLHLKAKTWPTAEQYGMIWVWTGEVPQQPLPFLPEWENREYDFSLGKYSVINCHPNVMMINAIDTQHFNIIHKVRSLFEFEKQELNHNAISFSKTTNLGGSFWLRLLHRLYKHGITYSVCYWYASTGIMTLGFNNLQVHIMVAMRLVEGEKAESQTLIMVKKRQGIFGKLSNKFMLWLAKIVSQDLIQTENKVFRTIHFDLRTPTQEDDSILQFITHLEKQKPLKLGTWNLVRSQPEGEIREKREKWRDELIND
ncbi:aromatic ring-hydroxylating dioxygenase subunit alpha [Cronbergia sp. UHCC 0137]|uniref:aromatic ring-hydroxylating dioxygenase subunit alpha n=1 Tax=Cronbergia sp. UHCC 0137 TaxID=3110239 RepID=UPI002B1F144C|nr:aromatic ring-hydroxylating dioxygenase subunit alpha [Cronbergia sp. UHCC 0137]MEA5621040.1 aromatic ring-hydroxylating dioxygenase subunit alpha [Cronbergia sp. UHCC 0137]